MNTLAGGAGANTICWGSEASITLPGAAAPDIFAMGRGQDHRERH